MSQDKCANCRFWREINEVTHVGLCLRYPPRQLAPVTNADLPGAPKRAKIVDLMRNKTDWPATNATNWCGEFKDRLTP